MVKAGADGIASDMLPLVSGDNGKVSLVLPGSSIKGALREHAERVVRTVKLDTAPDWLRETDPKKRFLSAVEMELIDELFGKRGQKDKDQEDHGEKDKDRESNDSGSESWRPGLGALSVRDCYATQKLSRQQWQAIEAASDDVQLQQALRQAGLEKWSQAYHVAVDRWLGSAAEAMLYTVLEPHAVQWEPICLEVNLARLPEDKQLAAVALLLVVLRDLARGFLPLGFATHRGMGAVRVSQMTIVGHALGGEWNGFQQAQIPGDKLSALPSNVLALLEDAWRK
ncbi:MAG: hypothetical protein KatS3mg110_0506 [Pirellulaceae bacterium]|nr:MAG: hypothetical protein KatS3mg110_0506 [Pirellulaceae bacterium]